MLEGKSEHYEKKKSVEPAKNRTSDIRALVNIATEGMTEEISACAVCLM